MTHWRFMDYYDQHGKNLIMEWYLVQDRPVQADFDVVLRILSVAKDWSGLKQFKVMTGKHRGLCELRFKTNNVRYRPVGFFASNPKESVLLLGCKKSGSVYTPPNTFDLAMNLKKMFEEGKGTIREHILF